MAMPKRLSAAAPRAPAGPVDPGSTEHLVLLAARASGRIETACLTERLGYYPNQAVSRLCGLGLLERRAGYKTTVLAITAAGREQCPPRREIPLTPMYT